MVCEISFYLQTLVYFVDVELPLHACNLVFNKLEPGYKAQAAGVCIKVFLVIMTDRAYNDTCGMWIILAY